MRAVNADKYQIVLHMLNVEHFILKCSAKMTESIHRDHIIKITKENPVNIIKSNDWSSD